MELIQCPEEQPRDADQDESEKRETSRSQSFCLTHNFAVANENHNTEVRKIFEGRKYETRDQKGPSAEKPSNTRQTVRVKYSKDR